MKLSWLGITALVLCCVMCSAGCAGRGRRGIAPDDTDMIGLRDIYDEPLGARPGRMDIITSVRFENVQFEYDLAQVGAQERHKIEKVAEYLKKNPRTGAIIEGHCDERGSREYNMALGERRALAVRAYLIGLGIDGSIIQTVSYGEEKPLLHGSDEESWRVNRRAEFVLFRR